MKASIVILNFNGKNHLETFLPSVVHNSPEWAEIVVADNASTDDSLEFLRITFPAVKIISLDKNHGFAGGYNKALKQIQAEYYVLLNSDVEVTPNWLEPIVTAMDANTNAAAAQPKIRAYQNRDHFEYAGAAGGFIDKFGYPFCRGRIFDNCERDTGQYDDEREVFWATGACLVVRTKAYWQVEGLDESFFAHMEEIDMCWRLKNQGFQIYCYPQSIVYHLGGGTLSAQNAQKTYLNFRNNLMMTVKNDYRKGVFFLLFQRMVLDGAATFHMLFSRNHKHALAVLRAHSFFYRHLPSLIKDRKYWYKKKTVINQTGFYRRSIIKDFFIGKKKHFGSLPPKYFIDQDSMK